MHRVVTQDGLSNGEVEKNTCNSTFIVLSSRELPIYNSTIYNTTLYRGPSRRSCSSIVSHMFGTHMV